MRRRDSVRGSRPPWVFLLEAPEDEDAREGECQGKGEPGPLWHFRERRRKEHSVKGAEDDESNGHNDDREAPDDDRHKRGHENSDERHQDHTDSVYLAKFGGLSRSRHQFPSIQDD